ncbi:MAG: succinyldiaminopimelate transaminase, partial [Actinobacteria bacterium]|nr:succinyldiaminopimelate transaminase [Actinomycetota bacterium]
MTDKPDGFVPPPYPYDRLNELKPLGQHHEGGLIDFSIGTPMAPPPTAVVRALASSGSEKGYPPSIGRPELRHAFASWLAERT